MKKLIQGVVDFRQQRLAEYRMAFAHLALGQRPDTLMIACSDSRVAPNVFASTDPGDLFVVRNVGNMVSACGDGGFTTGDESEAAAIEFALLAVGVSDIVVCGHSDCGAMKAMLTGELHDQALHLGSWLKNGQSALRRLAEEQGQVNHGLSNLNRLSQLNVLEQLQNLKTYPVVRERLKAKKLRLHAWWFELKLADVFAYDCATDSFRILEGEFADTALASVASLSNSAAHSCLGLRNCETTASL